MVLEAPGLVLRRWGAGDVGSLVRYADNRKVWLNVRDLFPHPYTQADARDWVARCAREDPPRNLAIAVDGEAVGGIGVSVGDDIHRLSGEVGYWLGEPFWGRGLASAALVRFTEHAFEQFDLVRLYGRVLEYNPASARVLEKAGYAFEARLRRAVIKDGRIVDELIYARLR